MPEGHSVHRTARDHDRWFAGQELIVMSPQGRFEDQADQLCGKRLIGAEAHGKHLFYRFGNRRRASQRLMHVHLGLYGKFRLHKNPPPPPRGAVRVRMIGQSKSFDLNGPNCCELLDDEGLEVLKQRLGQDPLRKDAEPEVAWQRISRSRAKLGTLLLNQSIIAGIGNIFRAEILFLLGIHPERTGQDLSRDEFDQMWSLTQRLFQVALKYNRIITVDRKDVSKPLSRLTRGERLVCYKKERCLRCQSLIRKWELGNRTMYACEHCQM